MCHVKDNLAAFIASLKFLVDNNMLNSDGLVDAEGLLTKIKTFEFVVMLLFWFDVLTISKGLTDYVQSPKQTISVTSNLKIITLNQS